MNRCVKLVKVCVTWSLQDNVNSKNNVTPSTVMNQFMLLFIGGSISPTEFKVSYFPLQVTYADYEYSTTTGQIEITLLSSYNS